MPNKIEKAMKVLSEAAGMLIVGPNDLSTALACLVKNVGTCAQAIAYIKQEDHMGSSFRAFFTSVCFLLEEPEMMFSFVSSFLACKTLLGNLMRKCCIN